MAQRDTTRKTRAPRRAREQAVAPAEAVAGELHALERERDRLAGELETARQRIAELERLHDLAVNRIDWVLDSLHNLVEQES